MWKKHGLTTIELLVVIGILAILFLLLFLAIRQIQRNAKNVAIRNDVRQLRLLAEEVYDNQGASYADWLSNPLIASQVTTLRNDVDRTLGDPAGAPWKSVIIDTREKEYCISSQMVQANPPLYYCVDTHAQFVEIGSPCRDPGDDTLPLICPAS